MISFLFELGIFCGCSGIGYLIYRLATGEWKVFYKEPNLPEPSAQKYMDWELELLAGPEKDFKPFIDDMTTNQVIEYLPEAVEKRYRWRKYPTHLEVAVAESFAYIKEE